MTGFKLGAEFGTGFRHRAGTEREGRGCEAARKVWGGGRGQQVAASDSQL